MSRSSSYISTLRNVDYVRMCVANTLVCTYAFMVYPLLYLHTANLAFCAGALLMFALGNALPGALNAWMMERFSRKGVYLRSLVLLMALGAVLDWYPFWALPVCLLQGVAFAMLQNALGHTLVNDLLASDKRTAGDNLYSWYGRFGLPFGWLAALWLFNEVPTAHYLLALLPAAVAFVLIALMPVQLKAPVPAPHLSLDRYWQPNAWPLFLMSVGASALEGIAVALAFQWGDDALSRAFFMAVGFLLALWLQRVVFAEAVDKAEMVAGAVLTLGGFFMIGHELQVVSEVAYVLLGAGNGMLSGRLLIYFLKLCGHCQRGTSQNTYMLGWRFGLAAGFGFVAVAAAWMPENAFFAGTVGGIVVSLVYLAAYLLLVHPWFERHRDRDFRFREEA